MECEICKEDYDPDTALYDNLCNDCLDTCSVCNEHYYKDEDTEMCVYCEFEMFMVEQNGGII